LADRKKKASAWVSLHGSCTTIVDTISSPVSGQESPTSFHAPSLPWLTYPGIYVNNTT